MGVKTGLFSKAGFYSHCRIKPNERNFLFFCCLENDLAGAIAQPQGIFT